MLSQQQAMTLPTITPDLAGWSMGSDALPEVWADGLRTWMSAALVAYTLEDGGDDAALRAELAARVRALTGYALPDRAITADRHARRATAVLDGVVFRLQGHEVIVLRSCTHCGTGLVASPPLISRADLGYALSDWQPYHSGCEPVDPADVDW